MVLACSVFENEIQHHMAQLNLAYETQNLVYFEMGLHDHPDHLRAVLQEAILRTDQRDDIDAVVLVYGLCGRGTAGLQAGRHRLVIPSGHDCMTVFLGCKKRYAKIMQQCPGCYFYTAGWNRDRRVPGPDRLAWLENQWSKTFDADDVAYLLDIERAQWAQPHTAISIDLGTADADATHSYAKHCADWLGWEHEQISGDATLLRDLLLGNWDEERFLCVNPGQSIQHSTDDQVLVSLETKAAHGP